MTPCSVYCHALGSRLLIGIVLSLGTALPLSLPFRIRASVSAEKVEKVNDCGLRVLFLQAFQTQGRALYSGHFFWTLHSFPFSDVFPGATAANAQFAVQLANRNTGIFDVLGHCSIPRRTYACYGFIAKPERRPDRVSQRPTSCGTQLSDE